MDTLKATQQYLEDQGIKVEHYPNIHEVHYLDVYNTDQTDKIITHYITQSPDDPTQITIINLINPAYANQSKIDIDLNDPNSLSQIHQFIIQTQ